jgi:hypothetical protein
VFDVITNYNRIYSGIFRYRRIAGASLNIVQPLAEFHIAGLELAKICDAYLRRELVRAYGLSYIIAEIAGYHRDVVFEKGCSDIYYSCAKEYYCHKYAKVNYPPYTLFQSPPVAMFLNIQVFTCFSRFVLCLNRH